MQLRPQEREVSPARAASGRLGKDGPSQEEIPAGDAFRTRTLVVALVLTAALIGWLGWTAYHPASGSRLEPQQKVYSLLVTGALLGLSLGAWLLVIRAIYRWRATLAKVLAEQEAVREALRDSQAFYASLVDG